MRIIFVHLVWILALAGLPADAADDPAAPRLPAAIETTSDLRQHLGMMLQRSPTFRQQCRQLDAPRLRLRVQIRRDPSLFDKPYRAITVIQRRGDDLVASVAIGSSGDPTEWLAHELEHVLEQIEGVNLQHQVKTHRDAWPTSDGAFETTRAIRAGRVVRHEVRDNGKILAHAGSVPEAPGRGDD